MLRGQSARVRHLFKILKKTLARIFGQGAQHFALHRNRNGSSGSIFASAKVCQPKPVGAPIGPVSSALLDRYFGNLRLVETVPDVRLPETAE